jgi:hypothetical protein
MKIRYTKNIFLTLQHEVLIIFTGFDQFAASEIIIHIKILWMIAFKTEKNPLLCYKFLVSFIVLGTEHEKKFIFSMKNIII